MNTSQSLKALFIVFVSLTTSVSWAAGRDLYFSRACDSGTTITIAAVGDLLLHGPLQRQAYKHSDGFQSLWQQAVPFFKAADIAYANLEGSVAEDLGCDGRTRGQSPIKLGVDCRKDKNSVYTSYPRFNYHPRLISDMLNSGIDVVSSANNHSLDRGALGAELTIDQLEAAGMAYTGTRRKSISDEAAWTTVTEVKGFRLGWVSCTYGTNGVPDPHDQVLHCFDNDRVTDIIKSLRPQVDAVIVTPHWGKEYKTEAHWKQEDYGRNWLDAGATMVIGSHPHVLQPWETYKTEDGRETLIVYSLGNFVSNQSSLEKRTTIILWAGLTFNNGEVWVNGARYVPATMKNRRSFVELLVDDFSEAWNSENEIYSFLHRQFGEQGRMSPGDDLLTNPRCF